MVGGLLAAVAERNDTAYFIGKWVGYVLVAAAAWAIWRAIRSGRFKAGLQRIAIENKASADAQASAASGSTADVGGIHLHVGHNVAGVGTGGTNDHDVNRPIFVNNDDDGDDHYVLRPGADVGLAVRRLAGLPTGDSYGRVEDAGRASNGALVPRAAGGGGGRPDDHAALRCLYCSTDHLDGPCPVAAERL